MPLLTYLNHYKTGYDNIHFSHRFNLNQRFFIDFNRCLAFDNFKNESIKTAKQIYNDAGQKPLLISLSGGIDSEYVCNVFLEAKIPFKAIFAKFKYNLNDTEYYYANRFCERNNIKLYTVEINIKSFFENCMYDYASMTSCSSPQFPLHMYLWDHFDDYIVGGHGDTVFNRDYGSNNFYYLVQEKDDSIFRFFLKRNRSSAPMFFNYRPEMFLSYISEPEIMKLFLFGKNSKIMNVKGQKQLTYQKYYKIETRKKLTGFEEVNDLDMYYRKKLEKEFCNDKYKLSIPEFINKLWPENFINHSGEKYIPC